MRKKTAFNEPFASNADVTVFKYNSTRNLEKIFVHRNENVPPGQVVFDTDVSDPLVFTEYDSLVWNSTYTRVLSVHTLNRYGVISSYKIFTYNATNDSLLANIKLFGLGANNTYSLRNEMYYVNFDNCINPMYRLLPYYGFYPSVTTFNVLPQNDLTAVLGGFETMNPRNCSKLIGISSQVNHVYNADFLPTITYMGTPPTSESIKYLYQKFRRQ